MAGVHGDFSLSNVVYSGKETVLIDFSNLETGSVYYDLTRFYHQLGLLLHKPSFGTATISRLRKAFVAGYDEKLNEASPLFRLFMVQHLVCHWLGRLKMAEPSFHARAYNYWICYRHRQELDRFLVVGDGYAF